MIGMSQEPFVADATGGIDKFKEQIKEQWDHE
jgi:hypothetical protein